MQKSICLRLFPNKSVPQLCSSSREKKKRLKVTWDKIPCGQRQTEGPFIGVAVNNSAGENSDPPMTQLRCVTKLTW